VALTARYLADESALARLPVPAVYDADFERIAAVGGARHEWVVPQGSVSPLALGCPAMGDTWVPKRVAITGGAGFIGRAVGERYRALGCEVVGVDVQPDLSIGVVGGDTSVPGPWQDAIVEADLVVHTAALVSNTSGLARAWEVNVLGTRNVLDAAAGVRRFLHLSSVRAFSDLDFPAEVDEHHPVRPDGHEYVDTKIASEQVALQAHGAGEVAVTVIRPGDVYGPGSLPWTVWPVLGILSSSFAIPDDGSHIFSPTYIDNLVDGLVAAAASDDAAGQVFTLSDGIGVTNLEFFGHYYRMLEREPELLPAAEVARRFDEAGVGADTIDYLLRRHTYSIAKAEAMLGYQPSVDLATGMDRCEAWLREHGLVG
jgi:nucleoside-diphosphate-sugar epimerase